MDKMVLDFEKNEININNIAGNQTICVKNLNSLKFALCALIGISDITIKQEELIKELIAASEPAAFFEDIEQDFDKLFSEVTKINDNLQ